MSEKLSRRDAIKVGLAAFGGVVGLGVKNEINRVRDVSQFGESLFLPTDPITPGRVLEWIRPVSVKAGIGTIAGVAADAYAYIKEGKKELKLKDLTGMAIGLVFDTLTGCTPKPEGTPPTAEQIDNVTAQATALPTELNPITATSTPPALESVPAPTDSSTEFPSTIDGLYIGEVTPGNIVGMIPKYESTGINTIYNPNDPTQTYNTADGQVEEIPPRAFGIDQSQLKKLFNAQEVKNGKGEVIEINGTSLEGAAITLKNGVWKAATGETFIPFIKAEPNTDAVYLVMDANGQLQKVDIAGKTIDAPRPMFEAPQDIAKRMGFEKADQVVDVEMNKNGSLSFITKEARPTEKDQNRIVQIVNEVAFIGEPEKLEENKAIVDTAKYLTSHTPDISPEALLENIEIMRSVGTDQKEYDVVVSTISRETKPTSYSLVMRGSIDGEWVEASLGSLSKSVLNMPFGAMVEDYPNTESIYGKLHGGTIASVCGWKYDDVADTSPDFSYEKHQLGFANEIGYDKDPRSNIFNNILWGSNMPKGFEKFTREEGISWMNEYIDLILGKYSNKIDSFVVVNEPRVNDTLASVIGKDYIELAFTHAREYSREDGTKPQLIFNQTDNHDSRGAYSKSAILTANDLFNKGLIDAVGIQGHMSEGPNVNTHPSLQDIHDTLSQYHAPLIITEMDVELSSIPGSSDEKDEVGARWYYNLTKAALMTGKCKGIYLFGAFPDKNSHYSLNPNIYSDKIVKGAESTPWRNDFKPKRAYMELNRAITEIIFGE